MLQELTIENRALIASRYDEVRAAQRKLHETIRQILPAGTEVWCFLSGRQRIPSLGFVDGYQSECGRLNVCFDFVNPYGQTNRRRKHICYENIYTNYVER